MKLTRPASLPAPLPASSATQLAKAALRRLALARAEPTPENYARAYDEELGVAPRPVLPARSQALLERMTGALRCDDAERSALLEAFVGGAVRPGRAAAFRAGGTRGGAGARAGRAVARPGARARPRRPPLDAGAQEGKPAHRLRPQRRRRRAPAAAAVAAAGDLGARRSVEFGPRRVRRDPRRAPADPAGGARRARARVRRASPAGVAPHRYARRDARTRPAGRRRGGRRARRRARRQPEAARSRGCGPGRECGRGRGAAPPRRAGRALAAAAPCAARPDAGAVRRADRRTHRSGRGRELGPRPVRGDAGQARAKA